MMSWQSIDILHTIASYRVGKSRPTPAPADSGDSPAKLGLYYAQAVSRFTGESTPTYCN